MDDPRTPRTLETREATKRQWKPAALMPDVNPEEGYGFRWIATEVMGERQPANVSKSLREGWEPVKVKDHPELAMAAAPNGNVEFGGLMLCKMPTYMIEQRDAYFRSQTDNQTRAIDAKFQSVSDPRMPVWSEKKSSIGRGKDAFGNGSI